MAWNSALSPTFDRRPSPGAVSDPPPKLPSEKQGTDREAVMKTQYVAELAEGTRVDSAFVLTSKEMRAARNGDAYLSLEFSDRTGRIAGVYFRPQAAASGIPAGSVVVVRGTATCFRGVKRISVDSIRPAESFESGDFLPQGPMPVAELVDRLRMLAGGVRDRALKRLLRAVFGDEVFLARFSACPASQGYHHAYVGGLIEHTVAVAALCRELAATYDSVDADLLVTAALLHDIGKVDEFEYDTTIGYSDAGRLLGHVTLGSRRVHEAAQRVGRMDGEVLIRLEHAIISHHGELEWGAPKRPSTIEALLLHHADNLDAKAAGFVSLAAGAFAAQERWTDADNLFRRPLYAPRAIEDDRPAAVREDAQYQTVSA